MTADVLADLKTTAKSHQRQTQTLVGAIETNDQTTVAAAAAVTIRG
jgi:hypothetical protein